MSETSMETISTTEKGWQKRMAKHLKDGQPFFLVTDDDSLADKLRDGKPTVGLFRAIFLGVGAAGGTVVGVSGLAKATITTTFVAIADPEPISKGVLIAVSIGLGVAGLGSLVWIISSFMKKPPKIEIESGVEVPGVKWKYRICIEPQK